MDTRRRHVFWFILLRLIVVTSLVTSAVIIQFSTAIFLPLSPFYYLILAFYFLTLVYFLFYLWGKNYTLQIYTQIILDLYLITGLVYISGGLEGSFYFLYIFEIIAASILLSRRAAYIITALAAIFFGFLVDGMYFGLVPSISSSQSMDMSLGQVLNNIVIAWAVFFLVAILMNHVTESLRRTREELLRAQKELEMRSRLAIAGEVAARVAHEIRNPLAVISGSVQVLKEELELNRTQRDLMDITVKESKRVSLSIDQFLSYAAAERPIFTKIDLSALLRETLKLLERSGDLNGTHNVTGNFKGKKWPYYGNAHHFKQIFWNLAKNSLKAMPEGGTLKVNIDTRDDGKIQLRFTDTGKGMAPEEKHRVFEPFFSGFKDGVGIGMAVVKRIIGDYDGEIELTSEIEQGTEVMITLPCRDPKKMKGSEKQEIGEKWTSC
jgi:two-component system sensor histidine kinase PilS (NtrC family)